MSHGRGPDKGQEPGRGPGEEPGEAGVGTGALAADRDRGESQDQELDQYLRRPRLCAAIVDRLTFGGAIIETGTNSGRLAQARSAHPS